MNDLTPTREQRTAALEGMGCKRKRVEDIRFTQGKGNYVDDVKLPGMLHGDFVRSPHAHARVKSINSEEALKVPGVLAVITAETPFCFNHPNRRRISLRRTPVLERPANNASGVSRRTRLAPTESIAPPSLMNNPSRSYSPVSAISLLSM